MIKVKSDKIDLWINPHKVLYIQLNDKGNSKIKMENGELLFSNERPEELAKKLDDYL